MIRRAAIVAAALGSGFVGTSAVEAQLTLPVLQPVIPFTYSRGRNVSVTERDRPEVTATGLPVGGFTAYPRIDLGAGFTNNVFETNLDKKSSAFVSIVPQIRAYSDWSRNALNFDLGADLRRYTAESVRDQSGWHVGSTGRYDIGGDSSVSASASTAKQYETRFSGSTPGDVASAIPYQISNGQFTSQTAFGKFRLIGIGDYTNLNFMSIELLNGTRRNQDYRDRNQWTGTGQLEYALSQDVSVFGQLGYQSTNYYAVDPNGLNNRDSRQVKGAAGISLDITSLIRGSFGIGYSDRHYDSPDYSRVAGVSFEGRFEYFPSELTTITVAGRRAIEDASITGSSGYFNTGVGAKIDHELLRNLIVTAGLDYERDTYRGVDATARVFSANGGARYLMTRNFGLAGTVSYGQRHTGGERQIGSVFNETSGLLSIFFQK